MTTTAQQNPQFTNDNSSGQNDKTIGLMDRCFNVFVQSQGEIAPHFFVTGPSGSGKSYWIEKLCEKHDVSFIQINAAGLTKEGTSGNSLSKAFSPLLNRGNRLVVIWLDEVDKLFISGNSNQTTAHEVTLGVQNEILTALDGAEVQVFGDYGKYIPTACDKALFVFSGAFNGEENITSDRLLEIGVKTELIGRVPLVFNMKRLSLNELASCLWGMTLFNNYLELFNSSDKKEEIWNLIMTEVSRLYEHNTVGIRILSKLVTTYFISGGKLEKDEVKRTTFNRTLDLN